MRLSEHGSCPARHANNAFHNGLRIHRDPTRTHGDPIAIAHLNHHPYSYPHIHTYIYPFAHTPGVLEKTWQSRAGQFV